jgi:hypothetical protein
MHIITNVHTNRSRVTAYREGCIDAEPQKLAESRAWLIERRLKLKQVFGDLDILKPCAKDALWPV